ncbi:hypothetical protein ACFW2D_07805 [Streptomyces sp. NPDC058914]|uniref:hypothetical protein n=1 Tax=Streptomyces TaxID=1883 RepID=UPI00367BD228
MGAFLALSSAVLYGLVDFAGGILSRRTHFTAVTVLGQIGGLAPAVAAAVLVPSQAVHRADLLWGALSGVGSGMAVNFLNRGLSRGDERGRARERRHLRAECATGSSPARASRCSASRSVRRARRADCGLWRWGGSPPWPSCCRAPAVRGGG